MGTYAVHGRGQVRVLEDVPGNAPATVRGHNLGATEATSVQGGAESLQVRDIVRSLIPAPHEVN